MTGVQTCALPICVVGVEDDSGKSLGAATPLDAGKADGKAALFARAEEADAVDAAVAAAAA